MAEQVGNVRRQRERLPCGALSEADRQLGHIRDHGSLRTAVPAMLRAPRLGFASQPAQPLDAAGEARLAGVSAYAHGAENPGQFLELDRDLLGGTAEPGRDFRERPFGALLQHLRLFLIGSRIARSGGLDLVNQ